MKKKQVIALRFAWLLLPLLIPPLAFLQITQPAVAQSTVGATPTPDPTLVSMQDTIDAMGIQIAILESEVSLYKQAAEIQSIKDFAPTFVILLMVAAIGIAFAVISPLIMLRWAKDKIEKSLDAAIYRANPTFFPIYIPNQDFENETRLLKKLGFRKLKAYNPPILDVKPNSIVIYPAKSIDDIDALIDFMSEKQLTRESSQFAFIVYTKGRIEDGDKIYQAYDLITYANSPVTIVTHIYALARGLMK